MKIWGPIVSFLLFIFLLIFSSKPVFATVEIKPTLTWQRSTEASDKVVTETSVGSKINDARELPLDPNQTVFDNGVSTPQVNKNAVASGISWASWSQYSSGGNTCGPIYDLRHFQAKFNLSESTNTLKVILKSPYYVGNTFPINDNAYIFINGNFIKQLGTSYGATRLGFGGTAPYANETDGWVADGDLGASAAQHLIVGENVIDIVAGEVCLWGGMGKLELVLEMESPQPFLDLPWDYQGKEFKNEALNIYSYFDHEYPLIFTEPTNVDSNIVTFTGNRTPDLRYSGHNGYDYPLVNGTSILAPADGLASFRYDIDGGQTIIIYHNTGFFTWYMHLQDTDLIVSHPGQTIQVVKGQRIGFSGNTGRNTTGPHLHVSVIKDINGNGVLDFGVDYPNGLLDPYGWEGDGQNGTIANDPWPDFGGSESHYLWINPLIPATGQIPQTGRELDAGQANIIFPNDSTRPDLNLTVDEQPTSNSSATLQGVSHTFDINAFDIFGNLITNFVNPWTLVIDYNNANLINIVEDTLSIFWFNPSSQTWEELETDLNTTNNTATIQVNHASLFVLMGEVKDLTPPATKIELSGDKGQDEWFRSDVTVTLNATDNPDGVGVNETYFSIGNDIDWQLYNQPLTFTEVGSTHTIYTHSIDKGRNVEIPHSLTFRIDKTPPNLTASATASGNEYSSGQWTNQDVTVSFSCTDDLSGVETYPNPVTINTEGTDQMATGICTDEAGNTSTVTFTGINIDKSPPEITLDANPKLLWPPNGKLTDITVPGNISDLSLFSSSLIIDDEYNFFDSIVSVDPTFAQTVQLEARRNDTDLDGRKYIIKLVAQDLAGNIEEEQIHVVVPHDLGNK